ncbi:MAG: hypothetical protein A2934_02830 [Candidatus Sungbacteria bacterium RIFCSPLOWO2_01_FULL_47_10]|uniref:MaoC-like domain-containing protein n=1 Tax=Candidatus Sungbacteria bacterium RIFCSPLOWO2_01_FULL_47_10 TaxID=1802276 RepID=A0A1G2L826_9BACT|nr:MAG: hypothetical protein A2934_02830 [Candidatus Sungbacteria bacterium RIFCSPLOWO2_01_FULL_47_10]
MKRKTIDDFKRPLFFEDFAELKPFHTKWVTVSPETVMQFAFLTGDENKLHVSDEFAKTTILGKRVAHGRLVVDLLFGILHEMRFWNGSLEALLGVRERFFAPVCLGGMIRYWISIKAIRVSAKYSHAGVVTFRYFVEKNNEGTVSNTNVSSGEFEVLVRRRQCSAEEPRQS